MVISPQAKQYLATPLGVTLLFAIVLCTLVFSRWHHAGGDFSRFVVMGRDFVKAEQLPVQANTIPGPGYDGQFFFRLALDPATTEKTAWGITLDLPAYRQQRILYPLLSSWVALGSPRNTAFALVVVNTAALIGMCYLFARAMTLLGRSPSWALLAVSSSGLLMGTGRCLAEPLAAFFVTLAIYAYFTEKYRTFAVAMTAAVFTREVALLGVFSALAVGLNGYLRNHRKQPLLWFLVPLLLFLCWQVFLSGIWGDFPVLAAPKNRTWPFVGLIQQFVDLFRLKKPFENGIEILYLLWQGWLLCLLIGTLRRLKNLRGHQHSTSIHWLLLTNILWLCLASTFSTQVWSDDWGFMRILAEWNIYCITLVLVTGRTLSRTFLVYSAALFAGSFLRLVVRP